MCSTREDRPFLERRGFGGAMAERPGGAIGRGVGGRGGEKALVSLRENKEAAQNAVENKQIFIAEARQATDMALFKKQSATEMYVMVFIAIYCSLLLC